MRFLSFDDAEPGVIAIGGAPIGILAIGGAAVGVVAIGFGAIGLVAVTCGGGAGAVTFSCGLGFGGWVSTVGVGFGLRAHSVGSEISVLPEEDDAFPRAKPSPEGKYERADEQRVELAEIGPRARSGWARVKPTRSGDAEPWSIEIDGEEIPLEPFAATTLHTWDGKEGPLLAHVKSETAAPEGQGAGYRDAAPTRYARQIDEILFPTRDRDPENADLGKRRAWWIARHALKGVAFAGMLAIVGFFLHVRLSELEMTHTATAVWSGKLGRVEGMMFPTDSTCTVTARMRSDGKERARVAVEVSCGSLVIYPSTRSKCDLTESLVPETREHYVYSLTCDDDGAKPSDDDHDGRPGLALSTSEGKLVVQQDLPHPFRVEITIDPRSTEVLGVPLFSASRR